MFEASRAKAVEKLNHFIENNLLEYSKLRNFDFGANNKSNVSCLSPYITHGIINELEVIDKSLKKFSFVKNEKFIQEVLWRVYWQAENGLTRDGIVGPKTMAKMLLREKQT